MTRTDLTTSPLAPDLALVLAGSEALWRALDGARVLITGGTGFVGCWLIEAALWARAQFGVQLHIDVLARRPERLTDIAPHLAADSAVHLTRGDIRNGGLATAGYTHVIHAATETNVALDNPAPLAAFDASVNGTRHVLDLCRRDRVQRFLLISSGAVYGRGRALQRAITEDDALAGVRGDLAGAYALGKASAEFLAMASANAHGFTAVAARCFAFVGAYQPFDSGFAVGNFIRDALADRSILIKGDGTPMRSYLYGADMALWLWTALAHGDSGDIFNVGSDQPVSIRQLAACVAREVAAVAPVSEQPVIVAQPPASVAPEFFVPDVSRARERLALDVITPLDEAIRRTARWARSVSPHATRRAVSAECAATLF